MSSSHWNLIRPPPQQLFIPSTTREISPNNEGGSSSKEISPIDLRCNLTSTPTHPFLHEQNNVYSSFIIPSIKITPATSPIDDDKNDEGSTIEKIEKKVEAVLQGFTQAKRTEWLLLHLLQGEGDVCKFVDILSRKILGYVPLSDDQKVIGLLIKSIIQHGIITNTKVIDIFRCGLMLEYERCSFIQNELYKQLGVFLLEVFHDENDLFWLKYLTDNFPSSNAAICQLIKYIILILKSRLPLSQFKELFHQSYGWSWMEVS